MKSTGSLKQNFLESISIASIESVDSNLTQRCKFNFSFFTKQPASQSFNEWNERDLACLFEKLMEYSRESLQYWKNQNSGKSGKVLVEYGGFPLRSNLTHPKHVPNQALWGRFRLDWSSRLVGFILPNEFKNKIHNCGEIYDCNTFYVVFLDANHAFYKGKESK